MTLPIHEQDGLTAAEIDLRIVDAQTQQAAILDEKLHDHRDAIDRRLCTTDEAVRSLTERTAEVKGSVGILMASDAKQTELLERIVSKGDEWHEQDIGFRAVLVQGVSKIETEQTVLATQMRLLIGFRNE